MADFASAARNAPSEDRKCWQRVELGLHGLRSWGRNWSRKVRETWNSGRLQGHEGETGHLLSGTRETWLAPNDHLATVLPPHASRSTPDQRGQVVRRPFPAGYCHPPTAEMPKTERGPISRSGPSIFSMSPNRAIPTEKSIRFSSLASIGP